MTASFDNVESAVRQIGEELARLSAGQSPTLFERQWWSQAAMNLAMHDLDFKTQLFRFIDTLPSVTDDQRVVTLAEEYFGAMADQAFGLRWGLKALSATSIGARLSGHAIRSQVEQMARTFIAGSSIDDAVPVLGQTLEERQGLVSRSPRGGDDQRSGSRPVSRPLPSGIAGIGSCCCVMECCSSA